MTNKIDRTKIKAKSVGARTLAMVLCFVMLLTAIGSGSVLSAIAAGFDKGDAAVLANAVKLGADISAAKAEDKASDEPFVDDIEDGYTLSKKSSDVDLADTGREVDIAETGRYGFNGDVYLIFTKDEQHTSGQVNGENVTASERGVLIGNFNSGNDHEAVVYLKTNTSGTTQHTYNVKVKNSNGDLVSMDGYIFYADSTSYKTYEKTMETDKNVDKISVAVRSNGYAKVYFKLYNQYGSGNGVQVKYAAVSNLSYSTLTSSSGNSLHPGDTTTFSSAGSGGSSDYTYTYTVKKGNTDVTSSTMSGNTFTAPSVDSATTYTITGTMKDNKCPNLTKPTKTYTITVSPREYYYLWAKSQGQFNATEKAADLKRNALTGLYEGTYTFSDTQWTSLLVSTSRTTRSSVWSSSKTASWSLDTYNSGAVYSEHKDLNATDALEWIEAAEKGGIYGIKAGARAADTTFDLVYDPSNRVLYFKTPTPVENDKIKVYAKDGAAPIDWNSKGSSGATDSTGTAYNYALIGDTNMYSDSAMTAQIGTAHTDDGSDYLDAEVEVGSTIYVKTTISSTYASRYYVRGFCVNGVTYYGDNTSQVNTAKTSNNTYTMSYTIPEDQTDPIEITPIYYLVANADGTVTQNNTKVEMVTFYLQGYDEALQNTGWGNTPYVYPFYGDLENVNNSFGCYPGQPMVYVAGTYSMDVPVKNVTIADGTPSTVIKGITVNNGYADHVHKNKIYKWSDAGSDAAHKQTYDFDDFYKIYNEKLDTNGNNPNTITLQLKYEDKTFNASTYGGLGQNWQRVWRAHADYKLTSTDVTNIESNNGWEYLKNFKGEYVDIFGNAVTDNTDNNGLLVVSTGYNANIAGDYGTAWMIFKASDKTQIYDTTNERYAIPPSVLTMKYTMSGSNATITNQANYPKANRSVTGAGSYTDEINKYAGIVGKLDAYKGKRVKITYEMDHQDIRNKLLGEGAHRMDGRWLYTYATDYVSAEVKIEYFDSTTGEYTEESSYKDGTGRTNSVGNTTNCEVYFDNSTGANSRLSGDRLIKQGTYSFNAVAAEGWKFVGWEAEVDGKRQPMTGMGEAVSVLAEHNGTIYAKFDPINAGSLRITHTAVNGDGLGSGTVALDVYYNGTEGSTESGKITPQADGSVYLNGDYISNESGMFDKFITVVLTSTPSNDDTFTVDGENSGYGMAKFNTAKSLTNTDSRTGTANTANTRKFSFQVSSLYKNVTQEYKVLDYTSTFNATDHYYEFTYKFPTRGSNSADGSYTVRGMFTPAEFDAVVNYSNNNILTAFVKDKAPFESNFNKDTGLTVSGNTLTATKETDSGKVVYKATLTYSGTDKTYKAVFELPYENWGTTTGNNDGNSNAYKYYSGKWTNGNVKKAAASTIVDANNLTYGGYITFNGNITTKDQETFNHVNNSFITAPETILDGSTVKHFSYWAVYDYNDWKAGKSESDMTLVTKVFYTDFHDRVYGDYYIKPVYGEVDQSFHLANSESGLTANILFLGASRNQWNSPSNGTAATDATYASDLIYNDFAFSFTNNGKIIKEQSDKSSYEVGMVIQRVYDSDKSEWAKADSSTNDMSYYRAKYMNSTTNCGPSPDDATDAARATTIQNALNNKPTLTGHIIANQDSDGTSWVNGLNNKNRLEKYYSFYSQYGQTVDNENYTVTYGTDSTVDNYVYRAFAYIKDADGNYAVSSQPAYFSMKYVSGK